MYLPEGDTIQPCSLFSLSIRSPANVATYISLACPHRRQQQEGPPQAQRQRKATVVSAAMRRPAPMLLPRMRCRVSAWHGIMSAVPELFSGLAKGVNSVSCARMSR